MGVRRKRMHGKRRRKSSCAPFKHNSDKIPHPGHSHDKPADVLNNPTTRASKFQEARKKGNALAEAAVDSTAETVADAAEAEHQQYLETQPSIKQETGEPYKEPKDSGDLFEGYFQYGGDDPAKSIQGRLLGETGTHEEERVKAQEKGKDITQVAASVTGIAYPPADVYNIKTSVDRGVDSLFGITKPQSFSDAWTHTKGAAFNTMALAPWLGDAAGIGYNMSRVAKTSPNFVKGTKDLGKSLMGKGRGVLDAVGTVGNWGYWFDEDTGTVPGIIKLATGKDEFSWSGKKEPDKPRSKKITYPEKKK